MWRSLRGRPRYKTESQKTARETEKTKSEIYGKLWKSYEKIDGQKWMREIWREFTTLSLQKSKREI